MKSVVFHTPWSVPLRASLVHDLYKSIYKFTWRLLSRCFYLQCRSRLSHDCTWTFMHDLNHFHTKYLILNRQCRLWEEHFCMYNVYVCRCPCYSRILSRCILSLTDSFSNLKWEPFVANLTQNDLSCINLKF